MRLGSFPFGCCYWLSCW